MVDLRVELLAGCERRQLLFPVVLSLITSLSIPSRRIPQHPLTDWEPLNGGRRQTRKGAGLAITISVIATTAPGVRRHSVGRIPASILIKDWPMKGKR